jgi:O-antigen/teichoic acid export membrane protein
MKSTLHAINWWWSIAQAALTAILIGFYSLVFFGAFQLLLMAFAFIDFKKQPLKQRNRLRNYWLHVVLFFLLALALSKKMLYSYLVTYVLMFLGYAAYLAYQCVRYTREWSKPTYTHLES